MNFLPPQPQRDAPLPPPPPPPSFIYERKYEETVCTPKLKEEQLLVLLDYQEIKKVEGKLRGRQGGGGGVTFFQLSLRLS